MEDKLVGKGGELHNGLAFLVFSFLFVLIILDFFFFSI